MGVEVGLDTGKVEAAAVVLPATRGTGVLLEVGLGLGLDAGDTMGDVGVEGEDNVGVPAEEGVAALVPAEGGGVGVPAEGGGVGVPAEVGPGVGVGADREDEGRAVADAAAVQKACIQMPGKGSHSRWS